VFGANFAVRAPVGPPPETGEGQGGVEGRGIAYAALPPHPTFPHQEEGVKSLPSQAQKQACVV